MKPTLSTPPSSASPTRQEFTSFMPLVQKEVARMMPRVPPNVLRDDLVSAGSSGLLDALRKSPHRGPTFEWYARVRIRGSLVDELRTQDWLGRRARTRTKKALADGAAGGTSFVRLDDLPCASQDLADVESSTPLALVERRMDRAELERAIALLPEREAEIVASHYFDDVAFKAIAARLGVSEPRISQLHTRALGRLKTELVEGQNAAAA